MCWCLDVWVCWGAVSVICTQSKGTVKSGAGYCISRGQPCENNHVYHMQGSTQTNHALSIGRARLCFCINACGKYSNSQCLLNEHGSVAEKYINICTKMLLFLLKTSISPFICSPDSSTSQCGVVSLNSKWNGCIWNTFEFPYELWRRR